MRYLWLNLLCMVLFIGSLFVFQDIPQEAKTWLVAPLMFFMIGCIYPLDALISTFSAPDKKPKGI